MRAESEHLESGDHAALAAEVVNERCCNVVPLSRDLSHQHKVRPGQQASELIGENPAWLRAVDTCRLVATTQANVLLLGETGTGKDLLARSIHLGSPRGQGPFVRVDCTSLSPTLCESELYGHVRGAFTGAVTARDGRIRAAHGGTLFIDEVGDLPLDIQPKLLRFLQEREFEPVGSSRTVRVDVRVIAATHRDLLAEVAAGRFRRDLYYRLATFGIRLPPLRQRGTDISLLASRFALHEFQRLGKPTGGLASPTLNRLAQHTWPGNVRELQHVIERACIVCSKGLLQPEDIDLPPLAAAGESEHSGAGARPYPPQTTLREVERDHIRRVLRDCDGVIEGPRGAARILGLPPSTVRFKIRKLEILTTHQAAAVAS
jgi:formate hydrogenlyase transcriptional activator